MSGETEANVSGWTTDTLKEHVDLQFALRDRALETALSSSERRLDGMNEFRQTLADHAATLMPRTEAEQRISALAHRISSLEQQVTAFIAAHTGRSDGISEYVGWFFGVAGIAAAAAAILLG